ncbi:MAG: FAD-dependent oxidoreductase [Treponemataceae bacterium]
MQRFFQKAISLALCGVLVIAIASCVNSAPAAKAETGLYKAGVYEGSGKGNNGPVKVRVSVSTTAVTDITIVSHEETPGISDPARERIPAEIIKTQSLAVDVVTGASHSSQAIIDAVAAALTAAGGDVAMLKSKVVKKNVAIKDVEKNTDVVVIGGGGAGMAAAAAAAQKGAKVILVEKAAALGGNTLASGCAWNAADPEKQGTIRTLSGQVNTLKNVLKMNESDFGDYAGTLTVLKDQIRTYVSGDTTYMFDSVEWHIIQAYLGGKRQDKSGNWISGNFALVKKLCSESLPALKWLESLGVVFTAHLSAPVGAMWTRGHNPTQKISYFDMPSKAIRAAGGEIMLETEAKSLIVENGRVVGVKAMKKDGSQVLLRAKGGVVMATGGFGANASMVAEYNDYWPSIPLDMKTTCVSTVTGDGITMGKAVGARLVGMQFTQLMPTSHARTGQLLDGILVPPQNYVFVNQLGKRFVNEYSERDTLAFAALSQPNGLFYHIADTTMALNANNKPDQAYLDKQVKNNIIIRADTIEELAKKIGIDGATLTETVHAYNACVDAGEDKAFGKNVFGLKIKDAPFYAVPEKPAIHHTMGGLAINTNAQVLDVSGKVISGFYAAGEVTGGIHAGNRLGGNSIADIFVFGRTAGLSAAAAR